MTRLCQGTHRAGLDALHRRPTRASTGLSGRRLSGTWLGTKHPVSDVPPQGAVSVVPLADRAIGNLQHWLIGTYHGVSKAQLQVYLDEFVFRHNRRRQPMAAFQTCSGWAAVARRRRTDKFGALAIC